MSAGQRSIVIGHALAVDIGGTKIAAGLVARDGSVTRRQVRPTPADAGGPAVLEAALALGRTVLDDGRSDGREVVAAGIGTAGHVDHTAGRITYASSILPGWAGLDVSAAFQSELGLPTTAENDVNAMAVGEGVFGAGRNFDHILYVAVGTGIGGALVQGSRLWRGATWTAGELAHLVIAFENGRMCNCGAPGHLEAYVAGPALASRYAELSGAGAGVDLRQVAERAYAGDALARQAIVEGATILGIALGGLLNVLDPQVVIIGGGVAEIGDLWWQPLEAALRANPMPGPARVALRRAQLNTDAVLVGAGWQALQTASLARASEAPA